MAINQIIALSPLLASTDASGTVVLLATAPGVYAVDFNLSITEYFGATPGGPAIFTVVPEPTTGGLVALGLLLLGRARRSQRR